MPVDLTTIEAVVVPLTRAELMAGLAGSGAAPLAGGTWLFSQPQPALRTLVDLDAMGWRPLIVTPDGLTIAATCTLADLLALPPQPGWSAQRLFALSCRDLVASFKVQHTATVGGNICLALPAAAMVSLTTALDGTALVWSPDGTDRRVPVSELVIGAQQSSLRPGEVLRSVQLPAYALGSRVAHRQLSLSAVGRSAAVVIARRDCAGAWVVGVTASTPRPLVLRFPAASDMAEIMDAVVAAGDACGWYDDVHGAPDWRRAVTVLLVREVLAELRAGVDA